MFKTISAKNKLTTLCKAVGLCLMSACLCLSAVFSMPRTVTYAAGSGVTQAKNITSDEGSNKVYFGEYPQDTVIKVTTWTTTTKTWTESNGSQGSATITVPTAVNSNSVNVHTEIKNRIENLLKKYYSTSHTVNGETTPVMADYRWHDTTVGYFAPKEDYANDKISYDNSTGYYTLLESVSIGDVSYSAGSKFYPYNRLVDNVNKYYKVDVSPSAPKDSYWNMAGKTVYLDSWRLNEAQIPHAGLHPNEASIKYSSINDWSNVYMLSRNESVHDDEVCDVNQVVALHGYDKFQTTNTDSSADESYAETGTGPDGIFLYEVKPIEWTVVNAENLTVQNAGSGKNYKMLVSSQVIDSNAFNYRSRNLTNQPDNSYNYGKNFDNSVIKAWLNGYATVDVTCTNGSTTYTDKFYQSNRTFVNLAFSKNMNDLQTFTHTSASSAIQVGLLTFGEATSNNIQEGSKTQFALASGDQNNNGKYRWLVDGGDHVISRIEDNGNVTWKVADVSFSEFAIFGVRPVICLDVSSFANLDKVGDIDAGDTLNIAKPLGLNEELNLSTASYTTPNLLHIQKNGVVDGSVVVTQKGSDGTTYTVTTSNMAIDGKSAVSGFVVAGIRTYEISYGSGAGATFVDGNILLTPNNYKKAFIPVSSYIGGKDSVSTNTITNLGGQFVMTFYLVFEGNVYLIPAEKITNPIIYATPLRNNDTLAASGRSPSAAVNIEVAKILAGNVVEGTSENDKINYGHMSTLHFEEKLTTNSINNYDFVFKYPTIIQSSKTSGDFSFEVASNHETTFENVIFDGQDDERTNSLVNVAGTATFNNCVMKNVNVTGNGGALNIYETGTVGGTKLEISNCRAANGGGIYCTGDFVVDELILTSNFANGAASIYASTLNAKEFKISKSLVVANNVEQKREDRTYYANYAVYISGYKVGINNPVFKENKSFLAALYLENCTTLDADTPTLGKSGTDENVGIFEKNAAYGEGLCAGAMIVRANGVYEYKFSGVKFSNNSASGGGHGAVLVQGKYQNENGVSFENCVFSGNEGPISGALAFCPSGSLGGNFKVLNTAFYSNNATSTTVNDIAGALLIMKDNNKTKSTFSLSNLTFMGNMSNYYGVANINLNAQSSVKFNAQSSVNPQTITLGGDLLDGNKLEDIRNVSTVSGALFAIKGEKTSTISIKNFIAQNNKKISENSTENSFNNSSVLYLENLTGAEGILLTDSKFEYNDSLSNGGALNIQNCSGIIQNCLFNGNTATVTVLASDTNAVGGGAVYLSKTEGEHEIEVKNSTFTNNSVSVTSGSTLFAGGGAVLAKEITLKLTNVYAQNNSVSSGNMIAKGGAICSYGNTPKTLNYITKCQHSSPKIVISGGKFEGNSASSSEESQGGAIWGDCVQIILGGTKAGYKTTADTASGIAIFDGNKTKNGEQIKGKGGAIYSSSCFEILNENNAPTVAQFTGNSASSGGAVYACGVANIDGGEFSSNIASTDLSGTIGRGGAVYFDNSELTIKYSDYVGGAQSSQGTLYRLPMFAKIARATFSGNTANYGGAIYSNSTISNVGFAKFSMLSIVGIVQDNENLVKFESNKALSNGQLAIGTGGAIYAMSPVTLNNISFSENKAENVSAIYYDNSSKTFSQAEGSYVTSDKLTMENIVFNGNISSGSGVVAASNYVDVTIKNSTFTANKNAGAILIFSSTGGYLGDGNLENCSFSGNCDTSEIYSSDVIMVSKREVAINNCTFGQNGNTEKTHYGTAILVDKGGLVYVNNIAANGAENGKISHTNGFILVQNGGNLKVNGGTISYLENKNTDKNFGGGAVVVHGKASFDGIAISYCKAENGGAIYVAEGGDVSFAGTISNCSATSNGGGIYVGSGATLLVSGKLKLDLTYSESLIKGNTATNGGGVFSLGNTTVTHASIKENSAENGGGIFANINSSLTIAKDAVINGNKITKTDGFGAGIYVVGYLYMSEAEISDNKSAENITGVVGGGVYASGVSFEAKDMTFSGNSATQGGAMYVHNSAVTLSYCTFSKNSAETGGAVYLENCTSSLMSCNFSENSATGNGRAVVIDGGNAVVQDSIFKDGSQSNGTAKLYATCESLILANCNFEENADLTNGGNISHLYATANSVEILDSNFTRGACVGDDSGVTISAPYVWIERCAFNLNKDGGLSLATNYGVIANSQFLSNEKNGGLKLNKYGDNSSVEIIDTDFTNYDINGSTNQNGNISTSNGGAIYVAENVSLRLSGEINVSKNTSTGGAIYVASGGKFVITRGSKVVISDNKTNAGYTSNLMFANENNTAFLEGGLLEGSSIGITLASGAGGVAAQSPTNIPLETSDINKLFSDNVDYYFSYSSNKKQLLIYSKSSETANSKTISATVGETIYSMILSDITFLNSKMPKDGYTIDKSYFEVTTGGNPVEISSMTFSLKVGDTFQGEQSDSITLISKGDYTIGFAVNSVKVGDRTVDLNSAIGGTTGLTGEIKVNIVGEYLYIISTPQGTMTAKNASSFKITQAGLVQRSNGQEVAGTWGLTSPENITKSGYYPCKFTPKQSELYENKDGITGTMYVEVMYDKMYYMTVGEKTAIYADREATTDIDVNTFTAAMELLNDNGTFVFMTPYVVNGNETIAISKRINFVRGSSNTNYAMIEVPMGRSLAITCTSGEALFEGQNDTTQYPVFVVDGTLTLGANVIIRNFVYKSYSSSALHGIICNKGTLVLQGCKIYNNKLSFEKSVDYEIGGVVYNEGTMNILSGEFYGNIAPNGNGGFVYTAGKLTVSGGTIKGNRSGSGAGVYVANGGSAVLSGGEITHNNAQNFGGGIYVAEGGTLNLGGTQILSNIAGTSGAGLYKAEGGTVMLASGEELLTSTIESVEALNTISSGKTTPQNNNWFVILCVILMVISTAIFIVLIAKPQKPQTFDKK